MIHTKHKWGPSRTPSPSSRSASSPSPSTLGATYKGNPIGTGPFVFNQWNYNTSFICTKNPHYWRAGFPYLNQVEFTQSPTDTTRTPRSGRRAGHHHESEGDS